MFLKLKDLLTKRNNARIIIKYSLSFALFFFYLTRQTLGRDSLKHEEPLHSRAMSLLLVSWVKVDVSHAGLASICHRPEKSVAISRRYAGDPRRTVIIHDKWNYKSHPTSGNVLFHPYSDMSLKMYQHEWHHESLRFQKRVEWRFRSFIPNLDFNNIKNILCFTWNIPLILKLHYEKNRTLIWKMMIFPIFNENMEN